MAYENLCMYCFEDTNGETVCPHCGRDSRTAVPQVQLLPGTIIYGGRFLVGRALGQDANGVVYTALDLKLQRKLRIREYFPRESASRLSDGTVVPAAGEEDQFDAGLKRVKASVQNAENPANRHFFFEENGTGYIVQRKAAAAAPVVRDDDDDDEDLEERDGPNVKAIVGIAVAVIAIVAIVVFAIVNMLGGALDRTNGIQDVTKEEEWQPLELPTPTPYVAATIGANIDHTGDDWMNEVYNGNVDKEFNEQSKHDATPKPTAIPTIEPTPTPYAGLQTDKTINANSSVEEITGLQMVLVQQGWLDETDVTGKYDDATKQAVKDFQSFMNNNYQLSEKLVVDGIAGKKTLSALVQYEYSKNPDTITPEPTQIPTLPPTVEPTATAEPVIDQAAEPELIKRVQEMLISLNLLDPAGMDGAYGEKTRNAVIQFQLRVNELFGETVLQPTGVVNKLTWDYLKLYTEQYGSTTPAPDTTQVPATDAPTQEPTQIPVTDAPTSVPEITAEPENTAAPSQPTEVPTTEPEEETPEDGGLDENSDRDSIMALQSMLAKYGFLTAEQVDGVFGNQTRAALANFQTYINTIKGEQTLPVTGNADAATLDMLLQMEEINTKQQVDETSSPEQVAQLQKRLAELKWLNIDSPTDSYDDITRAAVRNFQEYINAQENTPFKLQVTGIADPLTLEYLALNNKNLINPKPEAAVTAEPKATKEPEITAEPEPEATEEPEITAEPEITPEPVVTDAPTPEPTAEPEITAEPEPEVPESSGIHKDSDPENIASLQNMLANYGFMGEEEVDGDYGDLTTNAVANFQKYVNLMQKKEVLQVTGQADENTLDWLLRLEDELPYAMIDSESEPEAIEKVQQRLIALKWLPEGHVTGEYDEATMQATIAFQQYVNGENPPIVVRESGYADITTQQYLLLEALTNPNPVSVEETENPNGEPTPVTAETVAPTPEITQIPTEVPTEVPTEEPTATPEVTPEPTAEPTPEPTAEPTPEPTAEPTPEPTAEPTPEPTAEPTPEPTAEPTPEPTLEPMINFESEEKAIERMQALMFDKGMLTFEQITGELDMDTLTAIAQFQMFVNEREGEGTLPVIDLENPNILEEVVIDYKTLEYLLGNKVAELFK